MKISFGILLEDNYFTKSVQNIVDSIEKQNLLKEEDYEIIVVGNYRNDVVSRKPLINFSLGADYKPGWLTKKRNIVSQNAKYENYCVMANYYMLKQGWYEGLLKYNKEDPDWDILRTKILTIDKKRYYDWTLDHKCVDFFGQNIKKNLATYYNLPYNIKNITYLQTISGGYILAKTEKILETPFIERMVGWEKIDNRFDDEWWTFKIICKNYKIKMNTYSEMTLQKPKWIVEDFPVNYLNDFINFFDKEKLLEYYSIKLKEYNF